MSEETPATFESLILITGLSGAGKSTALNTLADLGFSVTENLPVPLFPEYLSYSQASTLRRVRCAVDIDLREEKAREEILAILKKEQRKETKKFFVLFLDCKSEVIIKRYSETRRPHPGFDPGKDLSIITAIDREREQLQDIKELADAVVDTSSFTVHDLKREIERICGTLLDSKRKRLRVGFISFGFKHGVPIDCDLLIDVRFLPNPHFVDELREHTGLEKPVQRYVLDSPDGKEFLSRYSELLQFLLPRYASEGKTYLNIGIGCTGGKHRSVALAEAFFAELSSEEYVMSVSHRDIDLSMSR